MWTAEAVLVCALSLLGRSADSFPPIAFVHTAPDDASGDAEAYVRPGGAEIFLITSTEMFLRARRALYPCGDYDAIRKLASVLAHEQWHIKYGADEAGAYTAQLLTLVSLKAGPGTPVYTEVHRSMRAVLRRQSPNIAKPARARRLGPRRSRTRAPQALPKLVAASVGGS